MTFAGDVFIKCQFTCPGNVAHKLNDFPGKYIGSENNEYPDVNGSVKRADILYKVEMNEGTFNIEDETGHVNSKTLERSYDYITLIYYKNKLPVISIITTTLPHEMCLNELWISETDLFKPIIKSFPNKDSLKKLNIMLDKVRNNEESSSIEGLEVKYLLIIAILIISIMYSDEINLEETHIRLKTDLKNHELRNFIFKLRYVLKQYILKNQDFLLSLEPVKSCSENLPLIVERMLESSDCAEVGPMACVAGTISELSLNYLVENGSKYSIVENGGDIAIINNENVICGIYSNNEILGNRIGFEIKSRSKPLGICTSSSKIGHSISFGESDSVTVIGKSPSLADALATRIANDVYAETFEDRVVNAVETAECFKEFFDGVLIICGDNVGTVGRLPGIVQTPEFMVDL